MKVQSKLHGMNVGDENHAMTRIFPLKIHHIIYQITLLNFIRPHILFHTMFSFVIKRTKFKENALTWSIRGYHHVRMCFKSYSRVEPPSFFVRCKRGFRPAWRLDWRRSRSHAFCALWTPVDALFYWLHDGVHVLLIHCVVWYSFSLLCSLR